MTDNRDWIGRVRQADSEAEAAFQAALHSAEGEGRIQILILSAIAAELRAQRVSKRPGAGTATVPGAPTPQ